MIGCSSTIYNDFKDNLQEEIKKLKESYKLNFKKKEIIKEKEKLLLNLIKNSHKIKIKDRYYFVPNKYIKHILNPKYYIKYELLYFYKKKIAEHYNLFSVNIPVNFMAYSVWLSNKIIIENIENLYPFYLVNGKLEHFDNIKKNSFIISNKEKINNILNNKIFYFVASVIYFPKDVKIYLYAPDDEIFYKVLEYNKKIKKLNKEIYNLKIEK